MMRATVETLAEAVALALFFAAVMAWSAIIAGA